MNQTSNPKASSNSRTEAGPSSVVLVISGLGHIPAIKNSMFAIVKKENREWKRRCVESFKSQLFSGLPMTERAIPTPHSLRSLIALLPADDNWKCIPVIHIQCIKVKSGEEGAQITIQEIL